MKTFLENIMKTKFLCPQNNQNMEKKDKKYKLNPNYFNLMTEFKKWNGSQTSYFI